MARRRFQSPQPFREGNWWWIKARKDEFVDGQLVRTQKRMKVCEAEEPAREAKRIAEEILRPMNQGTDGGPGSAMKFADYVKRYFKSHIDKKRKPTRDAYNSTLDKHILPVLGDVPLRNVNLLMLDDFFSTLGASDLGGYTVLKIKEVISSALGRAVKHKLLTLNPAVDLEIPDCKAVNRFKRKPNLSPDEFNKLLLLVDEPYASMIYVCVHSGLRVSELIGLKWEDVGPDSLTIDERYCRGDWAVPKTEASNATIAVAPEVIQRIQRLKGLEVEVNWGGHGAKKKFTLGEKCGPTDLVFQSVRKGVPMNDQNILRRHLRPAAEKLKIDPKKATWRSLRTSRATWLVKAGVDVKTTQALMRHARASTTMEVYAQSVPEYQRQAVMQTMAMLQKGNA